MSDYQNKKKFEHKEGKGMIFLNEDATDENQQPHFKGNAMYGGKVVEIAGWKGVTTSGKARLSLTIKEKEAAKPINEAWT